ncbi:MAG: NADH-quinone oxidoreductase subunit H [Gemmatimonadaceae bacterium]|jgi:NADH-quinone oxidoreductase subunit H|nr:NADH-quinone oxidoreductase subunit H [Gemmatimonadaceae bacterium]
MTGAVNSWMPDLVVALVFITYCMVMLLSFGGLLTWVERKQSAVMSDRVGANRAYLRIPFTNIKLVWLGLFHGMADGLKMLLKENFKPNAHDKVGYFLAPFIVFTPVLLVFAVVPFGGTLVPGQLVPALAEWFGTRSYPMQIATLDAGLLVVFAFSSMGIIGAMLAGWASENKFSLLGGLRAGSQMISYELVMGLTVLGLILVYGTLDLGDIVRQQSGTLGGVLPAWGIFYQPFAAFLFLTAAIAENKRIPFDLPEAESELIAGYFTEYSAMKLGLFMFSEFIQIAVVGALFTTLFLGGYNLPFMTDAGFLLPGGREIALSQAVRVPLQMLTFLGKVALMCLLQIQIRWTLPRFRYDQMLGLSWKLLLPLSLANLAVTVLVVWLVRGGQ